MLRVIVDLMSCSRTSGGRTFELLEIHEECYFRLHSGTAKTDCPALSSKPRRSDGTSGGGQQEPGMFSLARALLAVLLLVSSSLSAFARFDSPAIPRDITTSNIQLTQVDLPMATGANFDRVKFGSLIFWLECHKDSQVKLTRDPLMTKVLEVVTDDFFRQFQ